LNVINFFNEKYDIQAMHTSRQYSFNMRNSDINVG